MIQPSPSPEMPRIAVRGAGKRYGELQVFRDVDLSVGQREIVALVGPSGCGKTTFLRCLDGLIPMSEGEILIDGKPVKGPLPRTAMVFQHFGLFPWKTVRGNVAYGLDLAGASKAEIRERVPRFIHLVGLAGFEDAYPYQLSGGMQQRCGLARALAVEPDLLLMDEPFAAVDAQTRITLQEELNTIAQATGKTILFVTHNVEEAVFLGDRCCVLSRRPGRVKTLVPVDIPRARRTWTLFTSAPAFSRIKDHVLRLVREEV